MAKNMERIEDSVDDEGYVVHGYSRWDCEKCGREVRRYRGSYSASCSCGAQYNASGQRLVDNWRDNPSWDDENIGDLEGDEIAALRRSGEL